MCNIVANALHATYQQQQRPSVPNKDNRAVTENFITGAVGSGPRRTAQS